MKSIIFQKLDIVNFKGIVNQSINFDMKTALRGANGVGKTTVADALWWVLFNKDSNGAKDFPVKRKDAQGNDLHEIVVEVQLTLTLNNVTHIFRRTQEEKWVTKRGSIEKYFDGNEQNLYYNELNMKTKEYAEAVNNILDEDLFKLLTNPMYFMTLDQKKRREELLKLTGSDKAVEESLRHQSAYFMIDQEWSKDINVNKSFTQFFEQMKQDSKKNADEILKIPSNIAELQRSLKELPDELTIKSLIAAYSKELAQLNEVKPYEKPQSIAEAERLHYEKSIDYGAIVDMGNDKYTAKRTETAHKRQEIEYTIASLQSKVTLLNNENAELERLIADGKNKRTALLDQYYNIKNSIYQAPNIETHCPVCKQSLPDLNIDKVLADDHLNWERKKEASLVELQADGVKIVEATNEKDKQRMANIDRIIKIEKDIDIWNDIKNEIPDASKLTPADFVDQEKATSILAELKAIKDQVDAYYQTMSTQSVDTSANSRKYELQAMINDNNQRLGALNAQKSTVARIAELESTLKTLEEHKARYKTLVYLCEVFERAKNESIENALSAHFGRIKWRLFKTNQDGTGYTPVCDPLFDGKPYDAQSTGEKILTGCDIIKCFQTIYEIDTPVIIDNRESLTLEVPLTSQLISMYADDRYTALTQC